MKVLKRLWIIMLVVLILLIGALIAEIFIFEDFDELTILCLPFVLLGFYIISYLYERKKGKEFGYDDKKINKYLIINVLLLILYILSFIINKTNNIGADFFLLKYLQLYSLIYFIMIFPFFVCKYIVYFSKGKWYLRLLGIILFIIIFFLTFIMTLSGGRA